MESPEEALRNGRKIVKREITRIITPGTAVDDELLDNEKSAFLGAVAQKEDGFQVMWSDVAAGLTMCAFKKFLFMGRENRKRRSKDVCDVGRCGVNSRLHVCAGLCFCVSAFSVSLMLGKKEVLLCRGAEKLAPMFGQSVRVVSVAEYDDCERAIRGYLRVSLSSSGANDVPLTSDRTLNRLSFDGATRSALDLNSSLVRLFSSSSGHRMQPATQVWFFCDPKFVSRKDNLQRLLRERINAPLDSSERDELTSRLSAVQALMDDQHLLREMQQILTKSETEGDAERALQRIVFSGFVFFSSDRLF